MGDFPHVFWPPLRDISCFAVYEAILSWLRQFTGLDWAVGAEIFEDFDSVSSRKISISIPASHRKASISTGVAGTGGFREALLPARPFSTL